MATSRSMVSRERDFAAQATVIGHEALKGKLLGSGPILKEIDLVASVACENVVRIPCVTVAFDTFQLLRPICHGDFVRLEARVISAGNSSIVSQTSVYRQDFRTGEFELTHNCIATFVAIGKDGRTYRGLPKLYDPSRPEEWEQLERLAEQRKERSARWREAQDQVTAMDRITHAMIPRTIKDARRVVDIGDTVVETRHAFTMKDANGQGNVFGGVILDWMDRTALLCARSLTKNEFMATTAMNRVHFKLPIRLNDVMSIRARVCRVNKYSLEVEVVIYRVFECVEEVSHAGYFDVLNLKTLESPTKLKEIDLDVTTDEADQDGMQALLKAHRRQLFEKDEAELLKLPPVPLSISKKFKLPAKL